MKPLTINARITNRDNDSLKQYFKDIYVFKKFTPDEEAICAEKATKGDTKALNELINKNLRFVVSVAKEYESKDCPLGDLINEGNLGLINAAKRFDPQLGFKFISYAVWWIRKYINEYQTNLGRTVRIPSNKIMNLNKINQKIANLQQKLGREVDLQEVIDEYGDSITEDEIKAAQLIGKISSDSLDKDVSSDDSENGVSLSDLLNNDTYYVPTDHLVNESDIVIHVRKLVEKLKPKEQQIIKALFGLDGNEPQSLTEVSLIYNVTAESVRISKKKILAKLKKLSKNTHNLIEINE